MKTHINQLLNAAYFFNFSIEYGGNLVEAGSPVGILAGTLASTRTSVTWRTNIVRMGCWPVGATSRVNCREGAHGNGA
jgi:hypothetical protein